MRRIGIRLLLAVAVIMLAEACVSAGGGSGIRRDPDLIVAEELANYSTMMLADAIRQLRPRWLRVRGAPSIQFGGDRTLGVVLDGGAPEHWSILEALRPDEVSSVRYHDATDATTRWGAGFPNGMLEITTRAGR